MSLAGKRVRAKVRRAVEFTTDVHFATCRHEHGTWPCLARYPRPRPCVAPTQTSRRSRSAWQQRHPTHRPLR